MIQFVAYRSDVSFIQMLLKVEFNYTLSYIFFMFDVIVSKMLMKEKIVEQIWTSSGWGRETDLNKSHDVECVK